MRAFAYERAASIDDAVEQRSHDGRATSPVPAGADPDGGARFLAGGTDLLTLMKGDIVSPATVIDIKRATDLPRGIAPTSADDGGLTIGALTTLSEIEHHPIVAGEYPALAQAVAQLSGGSDNDAFEQLRRSLGVDSLDITVGASGGPGVGVSRYISDNVRVGVKAGAQPEESGVTVDIDLTRRLKAQGEVNAEGGSVTDHSLADLWWRRLHAGEPTPAPAPTLQIMATPSKLRPVYHAVVAEAARLGASLRVHVSRFDADGAVLFISLERPALRPAGRTAGIDDTGSGLADDTTTAAIETLATKLGALLISLGVMHFFNMYLFHRIRRRALIAELPPPVPSTYRVDYTPAHAYAAGAQAASASAVSGGARAWPSPSGA